MGLFISYLFWCAIKRIQEIFWNNLVFGISIFGAISLLSTLILNIHDHFEIHATSAAASFISTSVVAIVGISKIKESLDDSNQRINLECFDIFAVDKIIFSLPVFGSCLYFVPGLFVFIQQNGDLNRTVDTFRCNSEVEYSKWLTDNWRICLCGYI